MRDPLHSNVIALEPLTGSGGTEPAFRQAPYASEEDRFRWGSRFVCIDTENGPIYREVPLSWKDLFDPQEGDLMVHSTRHGEIITLTRSVLTHFFETQGRSDVLVCDDVKMLWDDPGLDQVAPDIAVIPGLKDPRRERKSFDVAKEKTWPVMVLEVVSDSTSGFDYEEKPKIYRRAKVEECFHVDPRRTAWKLLGKRLHHATGQYRKIRPGQHGRLLSKALGLYLSIDPEAQRLVFDDAVTGERLLDLSQEALARKAAEARAEEEAKARKTEEAARKAAEARAEKEVKARKAAEEEMARLRALIERR